MASRPSPSISHGPCPLQILSEPFFNQLRTKEQLGYSLSCGSRMTHGFLGFGAQIQSGAHSAAYLRERLEAFLQDFRQTLVDMPEDEFQRHRRALVAFKAEKDAAMWSDALRVWGQISTHRYQFYLREADLKALEAVTLADAVAFYDRVLLPGSLTRRAVFVEVDCESRVHGKSPYGDAKTPGECAVGASRTSKGYRAAVRARHLYTYVQGEGLCRDVGVGEPTCLGARLITWHRLCYGSLPTVLDPSRLHRADLLPHPLAHAEERRLAGDKAHTDLMARAAAWRAQQKVHDMVTGSPALPWDV